MIVFLYLTSNLSLLISAQYRSWEEEEKNEFTSELAFYVL